MAAKKQLRKPSLSHRDRNQQEQIADAAERRIDADVMALYGVDALPD
jgi:hypothetical protein